MAFLEDLGLALNQQFGVAENTPFSLDTPGPSGVVPYGKLGELGKSIDHSAQRNYIEDGFIGNLRPRNSEILMQEPDITVLIKKRLFSSLAENYAFHLMNKDEKLFVRATKRLFYNKCRAIAAYERLTKIERIVQSGGVINDHALPQIFNAVDALNGLGVNIVDQKTQSILETIRKVKTLSDPNFTTTWIVDREIPYMSDSGEGTGVFELTMVSSMDCTNSINWGGGTASLTIEDPYKLMVITEKDIDRAILESSNGFAQNNFFRLTEHQLEDSIVEMRTTLNAIRKARNATEIRFIVNESALLNKKVRAFIDEEGREIIFNFNGGFLGIGGTVEVDEGALEGVNGLRDSIQDINVASFKNINISLSRTTELELFQQIIQNIYILSGMKQNNQREAQRFNKETSYVRREMSLHYEGKNLIQHMDVVHIFISSKTQVDNKVTQGLRSTFGMNTILDKINDTVGDLQNTVFDLVNTLSGGTANSSFIEQEKNAIVGPAFPTWMWMLMRNEFTRQAAGTHVFAGIIDSANHNYDGSKYTLQVSAKDNSYYLRQGKLNVNPSVDVFNSALYDPLTPFDLDFDASSGFLRGETPNLLEENIKLLNSGFVKSKNGRLVGKTLSEDFYKITDVEPTPTTFRRKFHDPDGFVYRWKKGIGSLIWKGEPHSALALGSFKSETSPNINKDPFSGQDVMNVLSLLITGFPYNYNNFLKAAISSGQLSKDDFTNSDPSSSFFRGLISDIAKQNRTWGNFVPFKKLVLNERGERFLLQGSLDLSLSNQRINQLLQERAKEFDKLTSIFPEFANNPSFYTKNLNGITVDSQGIQGLDTNVLFNLTDKIISLDILIEQESKNFNDSINQIANIRSTDGAGAVTVAGDDISFDPTVTDSSGFNNNNQNTIQREEFRKKLNYLTQRRLWKVKANEDVNLFIVDDSYDKNYDIQAFEKALAGKPDLFGSSYTTAFEQVGSIAKMLNLEVFADTQGHIQVRVPQYNRIPSSVFYRLLKQRQTKGIKLFPDFLESLFFNQTQGLSQQLEVIEDQIRIRAAALGYTTDEAVEAYLGFKLVTDDNGNLGGRDLRSLFLQASPDLEQEGEQLSKALKSISEGIRPSLDSTINFSIVRRAQAANVAFGGSLDDINVRIEKVGKRINQKTGLPAPTRNSLLSNDRTSSGAGRSQLDVLKINQEISNFVSERQQSIKLLSNSIRNLEQGIELNNSDDPGQNFLMPFLNKKNGNQFPEILQHMIEDEDEDDFGPGSGKRFILSDDRIINLSVSENPPDHTVIQVNGLLENNLVGLPDSLRDGSGGNHISTAYAVDYDMWRMYGFKDMLSVTVNFFSDPVTQCAPYAVSLLNNARKNILKANVSLVGNEYLQPGEIYYLEDRNLLFYSESVRHSFSYNGSFSSSMILTYGHNPGQYIPTMMDIVGKGFYSNQHQANLVRHVRHGSANGDTHVTTIIHDAQPVSSLSDNVVKDLVAGTFGEQNRKNLSNVLLATTGLLTPTAYGQKLKIEIRTYHNSSKNFQEDYELKKVAESIKSWILNPQKYKLSSSSQGTLFNSNKELLPDDNHNGPPIDEKYIEIVSVDLTEDGTKSPSSQAWSMAETLSLNGNLPINTNVGSEEFDNIKAKMLVAKVIDIWVTFTDPDEETFGSTKEESATLSQDLKSKREKYQQAVKASIKIKNQS